MICVSLMEMFLADFDFQIQRNSVFSSFFEFRLSENTVSLLPWILRKERSYRCIITIRNTDFSHLTLAYKISFYQEALSLGAEFIDWDEEFTFPDADSSRILYSFHQFERTFSLSELFKKYEELKHPGGWVKLVFWANQFQDNLVIRDFLKQVNDSQVVAFCMGEQGQVSRILACFWGSAWTYGAAHSDKKTAIGQFTAEELVSVYRLNQWTAAPTYYYGVLGNPVAQSLGPILHNDAFQKKGISAIYLPVMVQEPFSVLESSFFEGLSVTLPFKQVFLDAIGVEISLLGKKIRAINTLVKRGRGYFGENTDFPATMECISKKIPDLFGKHIVIWGSGGMAWSLALGFAEKGAFLSIQSRNVQTGKKLADVVKGCFLNWGEPVDFPVALLVNATPVGMWPNVNAIPASLELFLEGVEVLFETIYRPEETLLVFHARKKKIAVISGMDLFFYQAFLQQELWTGTGHSLADWSQLLRY